MSRFIQIIGQISRLRCASLEMTTKWLPAHKPPTLPSLTTIYNLFMQNEPNFGKAQMNVNKVLTKDYEDKSDWTPGKNKPNQSQFQEQKTDDSLSGVAKAETESQKTECKSSIAALQRPSQRYRPAGCNNDKHGQNYVSDLNFREKTLQKPEIDAKNSYEESQNCRRNQRTAQQTGSRLDIKCFEDSHLSESKYRCGHSAGWARQVVFLLEAAVAEPPAHIGFIVSRPRKQAEESNNRYANNRRYKSLARRCTAKNFQLILLVCLHNYVRIEGRSSSVK